MTHDTLLTWPRSVSTSHALVSAGRQELWRRARLAESECESRAAGMPCCSASTTRHLRTLAPARRTVHAPQLDLAARYATPSWHGTAVADLTVHAPQLDLAVVGARHDEGQGGVEGRPVHATVVALQGEERRPTWVVHAGLQMGSCRRAASRAELSQQPGRRCACFASSADHRTSSIQKCSNAESSIAWASPPARI